LGTFGYVSASEIARAIEHLLETQMSQETQFVDRFSQLLEELRQMLTQPASDQSIAESNLATK